MSLPADSLPLLEPAPAATPAAPPLAPPAPVHVPMGWLLDNGGPAVRYRALLEVARLPAPGSGWSALPYAQPDAVRLAMTQGREGVWSGTMLSVPTAERPERVGAVSAVRRLLECGWDRESPPLLCARRVLFRLLAEDDDPAYLFEFSKVRDERPLARRGRAILREAAAATLAQAGYESDPRVRGAARRLLERVGTYLRSPLAQKPWIRSGNKQVLAAEAAPPSIFVLLMLAHMPLFRSEHHHTLDRIYQYLSTPLPRQASAQMVGETIVNQPHLVLGDCLPHRNAADADLPFALLWLETMARLGFLRRHEGWSRVFDRLLDDTDRHGVWQSRRGTPFGATPSPFGWPLFAAHADDTERRAEVTFRLGLIGRLAGRTVELA